MSCKSNSVIVLGSIPTKILFSRSDWLSAGRICRGFSAYKISAVVKIWPTFGSLILSCKVCIALIADCFLAYVKNAHPKQTNLQKICQNVDVPLCNLDDLSLIIVSSSMGPNSKKKGLNISSFMSFGIYRHHYWREREKKVLPTCPTNNFTPSSSLSLDTPPEPYINSEASLEYAPYSLFNFPDWSNPCGIIGTVNYLIYH